ncbi:hypothetical protein HDF24_14540 [Mucilaginibacter sp. X4EP1]|uniref:hypothetical protein n=1 Tax=Mucilaginibacter sp. X4EP1 TaxID=2723092 RepID=UPI00216A6D06|nr:hypothetical protein [Mucilaginibacter sp. X4EP1]MCS3815490.1 hypothetical protein [Mucilaginibacter sp. X4EP1]
MKQIINLILLVTLSGTLVAQQKFDYTGTYAVNKSKIDFGKAPDWILPSRFKVTQEGKKLIIVRTIVNETGIETDRAYTFEDDKPFEYNSTNGQKNISTLLWNADKASFIISLQSTTADGKPGQNYTETWSLTDGGNTLFINRDVEQANGLKYNIKAYYDKK